MSAKGRVTENRDEKIEDRGQTTEKIERKGVARHERKKRRK